MSDVVVAPATPAGRAALALVRLTGADLRDFLPRVVAPFQDGPLPPRRSRRVRVFDEDGVFDDGVALLQVGPATYTGEDLCEIALHGNPLIVRRFVDACAVAGARLAQPGEFTRRAVTNGRLDLLQAESVEQVISARTHEGLRLARCAIEGEWSREAAAWRERLLPVIAELEARLDYPDDDLAFQSDEALCGELREIAAMCRERAGTYRSGKMLMEGAKVAFVGPVNVGKSSLINALVGRTRVLVHDAPGTTRDVVETAVLWDGLDVTLLDTAGDRPTDDPIEAAGIALGREQLAEADVVVVVSRAEPPDAPPDPELARILLAAEHKPTVRVCNGMDRPNVVSTPEAVPTCALDGGGVSSLRDAILRKLRADIDATADRMVASLRQRDTLLAVATACEEAVDVLDVAGVAVAADRATQAVRALDELTGADTTEDVLSALFSRFCVGK